MLLNNNWSLDSDLNKWSPKPEGLLKTDFESLKRDVKSYRFYQKCLSGSTYVGVDSLIEGSRSSSNINNVYDVLNRDPSSSYFYNSGLTYSQLFSGITPSNSVALSTTYSQSEYLTKVLPDYNLTLKNLFTPERLISDQKQNVYYVDLATTEKIEDLNQLLVGLQIDGFFVKEGQRILVKDQFIEVTLSTSVDPSNFFYGYYEIVDQVGTSITYKIPSSENGIYIYLNRRLSRTTDLDSYDKLLRYSIGVKMGIQNREKEFKLQRLTSGFYPDYQIGVTYPSGTNGESIYFEESHNFVLRQRVDYNNLYELSLNSTLSHVTQSLVVDINTSTQSGTVSYTIPQRSLTVGEFGTIINHQEGITNIIPSKYKTTLRSIHQTNRYYWTVGDEGLLLRIDKTNFEIIRISLNYPENSNQPSKRVLTQLSSIHFFNDLRGAIVGKFNQIWVTSDSGRSWKQIYLNDFDGYNFNTVQFSSIDKFYVGGDNGVFIEFQYNLGEWNVFKRRISKYIDNLNDEFGLIHDITSLQYFTSSNNRFIAIGCEFSKIWIYDLDSAMSNDWDFVYLQDLSLVDNNFGDVSSITWNGSTSSLFFSTFDSIYKVDPFVGTFSSTQSNIFSVTFSEFINQSGTNDIKTFNDDLIYTGNFSLWNRSNILGSVSNVYDSEFFIRLKPRLLFMDYDIGSKLYWFDDFSQYRIPERYGITTSFLQGSGTNSYIAFNESTNSVFDSNTGTYFTYSETNWITYFKDRQKTFEFYSSPQLSNATKVEPSFTFSSSDEVGRTFSYLTSSVTTSYSDIIDLMPIAVPRGQAPSLTQSSRFRNITSPNIPITIPSNPNSLYFYDYLGIWYEQFGATAVLPYVGDVLKIESDIFEGDFIINKIVSTSSVSPGTGATTILNFATAFTFGTSSLQSFDFGMSYSSTVIVPTITVTASNYTSAFDFSTYLSGLINSSGTGFTSIPQVSPTVRLEITSPIGSSYNFSSSGIRLNVLINNLVGFSQLYLFSVGNFSGGTDPITRNSCFMYFYTDFNENILNNIPQSKTGFTVRDLNKYPLVSSSGSDYFVDNFNSHYIGYSYDCELIGDGLTQSFLVTPKYSQWSAYYNLQNTVDVSDVNSNIYSNETKYASGFLNFGYSPTYNLLSYLNYIDPSEYIPSKEFLSMPNWTSIPGPDNALFTTQSSIFIDTGLETNKLRLGTDIKYIWDSLLKWTFVDVIINHTSIPSITSERLLIIDKYYSSSEGFYIIEFHDKINFTLSNNINTIDILSRRSLQQISDDLQYINRIHRPQWKISNSYSALGLTSGTILGTYSNYETELNFKVPTDSYCKILLSDSELIKDMTGVIYTDYKYELAMQVTKLDREYELSVDSISASGSNYQLNFNQSHLLSNNDWVIVSLIGTQSNYPTNLLGYHNIQINGTGSIVLPIISVTTSITPNFKVSHVKKDNFFNYQPIDLFDMGIGDKKITQSVEVLWENWDISGSSYDLMNLNLDKFKFRLIDGLDLVELNSKYGWILEAEISDAIIGKDKSNRLVWYKGIWHCGRWFGGRWISGTWLSGDWYSGNWTSKPIKDEILTVSIGEANTTNYNSYWYSGRWFGGDWENGTWFNGRWYAGTWSNGRWFDGTWNDGTWETGEFKSGIWVLGQWNGGNFNTTNGPAYWLDGKFYGGDFENGEWYNGTFDEVSSLSRFGTKSTNSRQSIWRSGKFLNGEFHSFLNLDDNGNPDVSEVHKYSVWKTGLFANGDFYGGLVYNINFKNTIWHGGISEDIQVLSVSTASNALVMSGEWDWNINDEFYILDNMTGGSFSSYGTTVNPVKYKVLRTVYDPDLDTTTVNTNVNLSNIGTQSGTVSNLRCVSSFENSTWKTGLWKNGVFDGGNFNGGIWYNGNFSGNWG